ncbi:MAG TPA: hypothetical protein VI306_00080 [Pyrinomonadaceae bacterium]
MSVGYGQKVSLPLRTANLIIWADNSELRAHFRNNHSDETSRASLKLSMKLDQLNSYLLNIRNRLGEISTSGIWAEAKFPMRPTKASAKPLLKDFTEIVAHEGWKLYKKLLDEVELGEFIRQINELPAGSSISIETDCALFPWEILYPVEFNINWPKAVRSGRTVQPERFWGNRYLIEYRISPVKGSAGIPPIAEHRNGRSFVSFNVNPTIDEDSPELAYKPVMQHTDFFNKNLRKPRRGELRMDGESIKEFLFSDSRSNLIYLYCHGQSDDPYQGGGGELLQVDKDSDIDPSFFAQRKEKYRRGPIVILNSCSSGSYSSLSFSSFHSELIGQRALGVIGPTIRMPVTFASAFGQKLVREYLKGRIPIGQILRNMRKELLAKNNPLGLFYVLQCPWHVKAPLKK